MSGEECGVWRASWLNRGRDTNAAHSIRDKSKSMLTTPTSPLPSNKGKSSTGVKPWSQLPPEIIRFLQSPSSSLLRSPKYTSRLIATDYILDVSNSAYCPSTWDLREHWSHRIVYTIFRDAFSLEKLMTVCPSWGSAREPQSRPSACCHPDHCLQSNGIAFGPMPVVRSTPLTPSHSIPSPSTITIRPPHSASPRITSFV